MAVLLTNLSEHMPHDTRLQTFLELAESVLNYFQPYLGRIEIMGSAKRIERVYFEISESSRTQWEKPQVRLKQVRRRQRGGMYLIRWQQPSGADINLKVFHHFTLHPGERIQAAVHLRCGE